MIKACLGILAASIAACALLSGCNTASCSYKSKCPNDGPTSQVQELDNNTLCNNRMSDSACGGYYSDYVACFEANQACTSSGVTDYTVTDGICGTSYAKWTNCVYGGDGGAPDAASE